MHLFIIPQLQYGFCDVWVGVAARLVQPGVPLGVDDRETLGVGVPSSSSSSSGLSLMVRSSQDACGAETVMVRPEAGIMSVVSPL